MKNHRFIRWFLVGLGTITLAALLTGSVRSLLAYPLTYLAWMLNEIYKYTPSWVIWGLLLIGVLVLAIDSLIKPYHFAETETEKSTDRLHQRVSMLVGWLNQRGRSFYRHQLNHELTELAARVLAQQNHTSLQEIRGAFRTRQADVPPELDEYFEKGLAMWGSLEPEPPRLLAMFQPRQTKISAEDDAAMEQALCYLEDLMEVNHDPGYFNRSPN